MTLPLNLRMKSKTFLSIVILAVAGNLVADPSALLERAESLYSDGRRVNARQVLQEWLQENGDSPEYSRVEVRFLSYHEKPSLLLKELDRRISGGSETSPNPSLLRWAGETAELLGDLPRAERYIAEELALNPSSLETHLRLLELQLLMGKAQEVHKATSGMLEQATEPSERVKALILLSRSLRMMERPDESWRYAREAVVISDTPDALYWIVSLAKELGKEQVESFTDMLRKRYPNSPHLSLLDTRWSAGIEPISLGILPITPSTPISSPVSISPSRTESRGSSPEGDPPTQLAKENESPEREPASVPEAPTATPYNAIQLGVFANRNNALELMDTLGRAGYQIELQPFHDSEGRTLYRVVLANLTDSSLRSTLVKLRKDGFDGIPVPLVR